MAFVQIIDCKTDKLDDLNRLMDTWAETTKGKRTASHAVVATDRADTKHVVEIVEFPSYEEAMRNSNLPETDRIFREMVALCDAPPTFTDLDVVRDSQFNKTTANRVFDEIAKGNLDVIDECMADDYRDHDFGSEGDAVGIAAFRDRCGGYMGAFDFTFSIESQISEGDEVATRWTWHATQKADFMGVPNTGKSVTGRGTTTFKFKDGKIKEGWWQWDVMGLMRQLGVMPG
ncbi:ester cyclase [Streptomyces kaniharaensis]|uniref:Ester cyclase n=1 Tax=Streptomyces kaniharaensis TaxID=212423 RepID=A0A6N7KM17_9ACTN|nr:ester cyclase [Streptomyces kaniharaensis]MQS12536.1 ester cyclase [Streptomyces kaniharaensis]